MNFNISPIPQHYNSMFLFFNQNVLILFHYPTVCTVTGVSDCRRVCICE
jgi:hypothetical protein